MWTHRWLGVNELSRSAWVDVRLPIEVRSVVSVVLGISRRIGGTERRDAVSFSGSRSPRLPSSQLRASGPNFRMRLWSSASRSISALRNLQFVVLTSLRRCSSSHTLESRRFFDMGRRVARIRLSTTPLGFLFSSTILGTNTRHSVAVVQNIMNTLMSMKAASLRSDSTMAIAAPMMHMMTTLYTDRPICLESLRAGMETCRVSQARKAPKICHGWKIEKIASIDGSQVVFFVHLVVRDRLTRRRPLYA